MKYLITPLLLLLITVTWFFVTTDHFHGLNSIQHLANYRSGLLNTRTLSMINERRLLKGSGAASVAIDKLGIPHIFGSDLHSLGYAIGYMHARDRYFQMELLVYSVMGRLSEIIGEDGIYSDWNWKRFNLESKAKAIFDTMAVTQPDLYHYLTSYTDGINAYLSSESVSERDPLYLIWDRSPCKWKPYYSFLIQWYLSFDLTFYDDYFDKQEVLDKLPSSIRDILYPSHKPGQPIIIPEQLNRNGGMMENKLLSLFDHPRINKYATRASNKSLGSNNWVVGSSRTNDSQLFLCNDLHLFLTRPNVFYEVQLKCPQFHVYGYTIPGVPLVLTGHNEHIAWGITNGGWDVTEQYLLKIDQTNKDHYWLDGKWQAMKAINMPVRIKGSRQQDYWVKYSTFGPVVQKGSYTFSLKWFPAEGAEAVQSFWKLMKASDWPQFREALRTYDYPAQNFAYADTKGNIGMICAGKMPVKPAGYAGGLLNGTVSTHWSYIPFDSLPQSFNPVRDYLFSANQEPDTSNHYFSSRWFDDLYRPDRINQMLESKKALTLKDMREMQLDITDLSVKDVQALVTKYAAVDQLSKSWKMLLKWNGELKAYKKEAIFYKVFRNVAADGSKDIAAFSGVKQVPSFDQFIHFLLTYDSVFYNGKLLLTGKVVQKMIARTDSLNAAENYKSDLPSNFPNSYSFSVPNITFLPGLEMQVNDIGGSDNTINVNYSAHPVIRTVIELKNDSITSWMVNAIGQTGRMNESLYSAQLKMWKKNELHKTQFVSDKRKLKYINQIIIFSNK